MRRLLSLSLSLAAALGLTLVAGTAAAATATPSKTYTVTRTFGPYNGEANWRNNLPGQVPDAEAPTIGCDTRSSQFGDAIIKGSAKVNRKTSHGTASRDVLTVDVIGAFWNPEVDRLQWAAWVKPTGRKGWNSVTLTITCRR